MLWGIKRMIMTGIGSLSPSQVLERRGTLKAWMPLAFGTYLHRRPGITGLRTEITVLGEEIRTVALAHYE